MALEEIIGVQLTEPKPTDWVKCKGCGGAGEVGPEGDTETCVYCGGEGYTSDHPAAVKPKRDPEKLRAYRQAYVDRQRAAKKGATRPVGKAKATPPARKIKRGSKAVSYVRRQRAANSYTNKGHHTPYMYGDDSRSITKVIRMSASEVEEIKKSAKKAGMSFSNYVRECAMGLR